MSDPHPMQHIIDAIVAGKAATHVRSAAARGALPLPPVELVRLWVALRNDEDSEIAEAAQLSLDGLDHDGLKQVLADSHCASDVLRHYAKTAARDETLAEAIAFHPEVPVQALATLGAGGTVAVVELVLTNQERLLAQPALLESLMVNPALQADQRGRILELLDRASQLAEERKAELEARGETEPDEEEMDVEEAAALLDVEVGDLLSVSEIMGAEELEASDDPEIRDAFRRIVSLNTSQKAILAMKGGREERLILIRDTNKVVSLGVLKNPRITEQEVESIAHMRNVSDDVLRLLGNNREWAKNYSVVLALVNNPKTPQTVSTNFVSRLNNRDLSFLVKSRDVPELVRRMAKRTVETRTQRQAGLKRK